MTQRTRFCGTQPGRRTKSGGGGACIVACLLAVLMVLLLPGRVLGQASAGITGTVTDTSGAVIANASITVKNADTAVELQSITSSAGTYFLKGLTPGRYNVSVDAKGFKKSVQSNVNIEVSSTATIDFVLTPGSKDETVEVTASEIALNTTQPELGSTIEQEVVAALPEEVSGRGRQIDQLQFLAPGTTGSTFSHRVSGGVDFEQEIMYNGIPVPQPETQGYTTNFNPPFDFVEEYRVERTTFSAQFGLGQGALTYQMKSGTNQFHGSAFEINRNSFFDSVGFFNGPAWGGSTKPPVDHENNYGFSIGGPVRIPHLYDGRNKTFFFYSQEWYKQNNMNTGPGTVPTALEKTGDFTDFVDGNGNVIPIYDPTTGNQFECNGTANKICPDRISKLSASLIPFIPDPDRPATGGLNANKQYVKFINPTIQHNWGFTVDHAITPKQSIHYSQWRNTYHDFGFDNAPIVLAPNPLNSLKYYPTIGTVFLLNYSNAITPNLLMTLGAGWIGEINNQYNQSKGQTFGAVVDENIPPNITFDGQNAPTSWGTSGAWYQSINRKLGTSLVNNWLWTHGRNSFNIGAEYRRNYQDDNEEQTEGGHFAFSQRTTSVQNPNDPNFGSYGSSFASFLLGLPDEANRSNSQELRLRNRAISPYIQDDIKINTKLTVNVGLRWDIMVPFTENNNLIVFFNQDNPGTLPGTSIAGSVTKFGDCGGCAGFTRADIHWDHIGPRLGFAYKLSDKMVVQGGFSIAFLDGGAYESGTSKVAVNYGNLLTGSFSRPSTGTNVSSFGSWDTNQIPATVPTPFSPSLGVANQVDAFSRKDGYAPYSQQWNLNLQRQLPFNTFLMAAFVGNRVIHLPSQLNPINQLDPQYDQSLGSHLGDVFTDCSAPLDGVSCPYANYVNDFGGSATVAQALTPYPQYTNIFNNFEAKGTTYYQSLQVEIDKRFSDGLSFLAGYTLSRLWDNTSSGFSSFTQGALNKYNQKPEWAISSSDEPQTLKVSGTYELPIGPGKKFVNNHKLGNVIGGWQVGWILDYEAGTAFGTYENGSPYPNSFNRPNRNNSVGLSTASYKRAHDYFTGKSATPGEIFNPLAFTLTPTQYVIGLSQRNYPELRNPAFLNENLNARKHFYIGNHVQGILTVDYFNALNRTIFNGPDTNANDANFGRVVNPGSNISNRQGQVSLRLEF